MTKLDLQRTHALDDAGGPVAGPSVRLRGRSAAGRGSDDAIDRAAGSDASVLLTGEPGVGKAFAARLIHGRSRRAAAPLVTLHCADLPDSLLESELFGHVRGSFTGAYRDKPGMLELAPTGTLFLDDVGTLSPRMQEVLLRFLESGAIRRVGADGACRHVDTRVVAAGGLDIQARVASGGFRGDLYAGLNAVRVTIPPLRERREEIPLLVESFRQSYLLTRDAAVPRMSAEAMHAMVAYRWPGNVRELKTVVGRLMRQVTRPVVRLTDLPAPVSGIRSAVALDASRA